MRRIGVLVAAGAAMGLAGAAMGQGTSFSSATSVNGYATVSGAVSLPVFGDESLVASYADQFRASETSNNYMAALSAGAGFRAETSAPTNGMTSLDTRLRVRDSLLTVLGDNDDGGAGTFSLVTGTVPNDGMLNIDVSHWGDSDYSANAPDGDTTEGWYNLSIYEAPIIEAAVNGQWWAFTGLAAGSAFEAEVLLGSLGDSVMAAWDSSGNLIMSDDDGSDTGLASLVSGLVPADGTVYISVTGYHGGGDPQDTQGYYEAGNDDSGDFQVSFIPTPGSLALLGLGGLVAVRRRR